MDDKNFYDVNTNNSSSGNFNLSAEELEKRRCIRSNMQNGNRAVNSRVRASAGAEMDAWAKKELSEYDSIATGGRTAARPNSGNRPAGARPAGSGTRPQSAGNRPTGTRTQSAGNRPVGTGNRPAGTRPAGAGNRPAGTGNRPAGVRPAGAGNRTAGTGARPAGSGTRPQSAGGRPQTAGNRTAGERLAAAGTRPAGTRPASAGARPQSGRPVPGRNTGRGAATRPARPQNTRRPGGPVNGDKPKKSKLFWKLFAAYAGVLLILGIIFLLYTEKCLKQYEASQAENAIAGFVEDFRKSISDGTASKTIDISATSTPFESQDVLLNAWLAEIGKPASLKYELDKASYDTQAPVYDIYDGEKMIAKMTLQSENPRVIFGLLKVTDWKVKGVAPVGEIMLNNYKVSIPSTCSVTINGVAVDDTYKTQAGITDTKFQYVAEYVDLPATDVYEVKGLVNTPEIKVFKADGTEIAVTPDESGNVSVDVSSVFETGEIPEDLKATALKIAQDWEDFITRDLAGEGAYGVKTMQKELIVDSYYYNLAADYSTSPDITFISDHSCLDPKFSDIVVDQYVKYTDTCFSCHISFNKNMYLRRTKVNSVETVDSTFFYVYYDDSDDGEDNPHWAMVDMIATTN